MTQEEKQLLFIDLCARLPYGVKIDREWIAPMSGSPEHSIMELDTFDIEVIKTSIELGEEGNYRDNKMQGLTLCDDGKNHFVRGYMCKPYLRPMSSMTEEEKKIMMSYGFELIHYDTGYTGFANIENYIDEVSFRFMEEFLNANHFDYRDLIPMGLALEAPEGMYKNE